MRDGQLASALQSVLPRELHPQVTALADLIASLLRGETDPATMVTRIADPALAPALAALAGRSVPGATPMSFIARGDTGVVQQITVGVGLRQSGADTNEGQGDRN